MGRYELYVLLAIILLITFDVLGKPLCAVCFFGKKEGTFLPPHHARFEGIIIKEPQLRFKNQHLLVARDDAKLLIIANRYTPFSYGDRLVIEGKITIPENFDSFDYQRYLLQRNIQGVMYYPNTRIIRNKVSGFWQWMYGMKERLREPILTGLPEPHASYLLAMTIGDDWRIPPSFRDALTRSGTIHIISISGLHMTIIAGAIFVLFILFGLTRAWATLATFVALVFYILLVGAPSPAIRSGIMGMLFLIGYLAGRLSKLFYALLLAAFFMLLWDIKYIYDVSFQLSFGAMAGLALFYAKFRQWFYRIPRAKEHWVFNIIIASLAVSVMIFPLTAYHFGRVSWISPIANVFILPLMPPTMLLGFLAEFTGFFIQPLWLLLEYQVRMISLFGYL
ncbi:MAG: ComEC/Rec2 family competence protein [Candidatus Portnoybacteria bacterium]|nr:ComEC/Rec2 family competence protein [Candidatus Portnoybacteria bacterium]